MASSGNGSSGTEGNSSMGSHALDSGAFTFSAPVVPNALRKALQLSTCGYSNTTSMSATRDMLVLEEGEILEDHSISSYDSLKAAPDVNRIVSEIAMSGEEPYNPEVLPLSPNESIIALTDLNVPTLSIAPLTLARESDADPTEDGDNSAQESSDMSISSVSSSPVPSPMLQPWDGGNNSTNEDNALAGDTQPAADTVYTSDRDAEENVTEKNTPKLHCEVPAADKSEQANEGMDGFRDDQPQAVHTTDVNALLLSIADTDAIGRVEPVARTSYSDCSSSHLKSSFGEPDWDMDMPLHVLGDGALRDWNERDEDNGSWQVFEDSLGVAQSVGSPSNIVNTRLDKRPDTPVPWSRSSPFLLSAESSYNEPVGPSLFPSHGYSSVPGHPIKTLQYPFSPPPMGPSSPTMQDYDFLRVRVEGRLLLLENSVLHVQNLVDALGGKLSNMASIEDSMSRVQRSVDGLDEKLTDMKRLDELNTRMDDLHGTFETISTKVFEVFDRLTKSRDNSAKRASKCTGLLKKVNNGTENLTCDVQEVIDQLSSVLIDLREVKETKTHDSVRVIAAERIFRKILKADLAADSVEIQRWLDM